MRSGKSCKTALTGVALVALAIATSAHAEENKVKETTKEVGHAIGEAAREIGHGTKSAAREVGHGTKKATKDVGKAASGAARETGHAFRDGAKEVKKTATKETATPTAGGPKK